MAKVHPNATLAAEAAAPAAAAVLTVWRKSLLFNCSGFTVFGADGNLAFRVDNYAGTRREIVLMDAAGVPLLTLRRKRLLSIGDRWMVYEGEDAVSPRFAVKKDVSFMQTSKSLAHVRPCSSGGGGGGYEIEGSYARRCCAVYGGGRRRVLVAEVQRKEAETKGVGFGADVFRLVVQPGFDAADAMGMVILLEQMFGSKERR